MRNCQKTLGLHVLSLTRDRILPAYRSYTGVNKEQDCRLQAVRAWWPVLKSTELRQSRRRTYAKLSAEALAAPLASRIMRLINGAASAAVTSAVVGVLLTACGTAAAPQSKAVSASGISASKATMRIAGTPQRLPTAGNPNGHAQAPPAARAVNTSHPNHIVGTGVR